MTLRRATAQSILIGLLCLHVSTASFASVDRRTPAKRVRHLLVRCAATLALTMTCHLPLARSFELPEGVPRVTPCKQEAGLLLDTFGEKVREQQPRTWYYRLALKLIAPKEDQSIAQWLVDTNHPQAFELGYGPGGERGVYVKVREDQPLQLAGIPKSFVIRLRDTQTFSNGESSKLRRLVERIGQALLASGGGKDSRPEIARNLELSQLAAQLRPFLNAEGAMDKEFYDLADLLADVTGLEFGATCPNAEQLAAMRAAGKGSEERGALSLTNPK